MSADELAHYLDSLARHDRYRVDACLKSSDFERTEVVFFQQENGEQIGPFVRKVISREAGLGSAYERIHERQLAGQTFTHIPRIVECYSSESDLVVVMDYVRGDTLQEIVYRNDPSLALVESVFPRICDAVAELHESFDPPLIHRDLKPSNIMIANGEVYIIDFGIAREYKQHNDTDTTHFGTRAYAPPEQYGFGQTTVRSDIYTLGMLLYYCLTEKTPDAQAVQTGFDDKRIPHLLRDVLVRATSIDPAARYASAREMKAAIESALLQLGKGQTDHMPDHALETAMQMPATSAPISQAQSISPAQNMPFAQGAPANTKASHPIPPTHVTVPVQQNIGIQQNITMHQPVLVQQNMAFDQPKIDVRPAYANPQSHEMAQTNAGEKPLSPIGIVYDIFVSLFAALLLAVSFMIALGYLPHRGNNPPWLDAFGYFVFIPVITISTTLLISYKRPLAKWFPRIFGRLKTWHYVVGYLCIWGIFIIILSVLATIAKS